MSVKKDEDKDNEYKDDNLQATKSDENMINKVEDLPSEVDFVMSTNFPIKAVNYVMGSISLCKQNMIEFENKVKKYQPKINSNILMLFRYYHC